MTPEEMATLLNNYGTPDYGREVTRRNPIRKRRYNVIVRTKDNEIVETYEMVTMKVAREIRNEAHDEDLVADIIEDWTIDYNDREINPKPMNSTIEPIPSNKRCPQPTLTEQKAEIKKHRNLARAQDNIARSTKNEKIAYRMYRVIGKGIDFQDTEAKVTEFLTDRNLSEYKIIYCGIAYSWGMDKE